MDLITAIQNGSVLGCDYVIANKIRTKMIKQVEKIFEKVDFIATPTTATGTVRVDANDYQCKFFVWCFSVILILLLII